MSEKSICFLGILLTFHLCKIAKNKMFVIAKNKQIILQIMFEIENSNNIIKYITKAISLRKKSYGQTC